ncbi:MAG: long-chain fatty acid--CoA ligase [Deltaproteobacteria bacterium]|nr:long-chain fatty acid--CoA ligase [Deltaproteobacteria bacterium]
MPTVLDGFFAHGRERPHAPCWQFRPIDSPSWRTMTWGEAGRAVGTIARWLRERGVSAGDRVALWSSTRVEWTIWDLAILSVGAVTVPVYQNLPFAQAAFVINEPACRLLIAERPRMAGEPDVVAACARACTALEGVVMIEDHVPSPGILPAWSHAAILNAETSVASADPMAVPPRADQLATIVYTSGTTGTPKGVELTHDNLHAEVEGLRAILPFPHEWIGLMFLPLAHIVARAMQMFQIAHGFIAAYAEGIEKVPENLLTVRPHFFAAVPRLYEKMHERIRAQLTKAPAPKRAFFAWAHTVGAAVSHYRQRHQRVPLRFAVPHAVARLAFLPVKRKLGGRLAYAISGGAPLGKELAKYFHAMGVTILEGYGLTETTAAVTINHPDDFRFGTIGKPLAGVHVRLAEDGEILVKGRTVFRGYYQRPQETRAAFDREGWFCTGDIGEFSRDGFLRITDRKKDLIKTSGGKYIAPQPIETLVKQDPLVGDIVVYGDRQKYLTALITLNREAAVRWAKEYGLAVEDWGALTRHPTLHAAIQAVIDRVNRQLASFETIKRFAVLDHEFSLEGGELTPTLKVKRRVAYDRYQHVLQSMYEETGT